MNKRPPKQGEKNSFYKNTLLIDGNSMFKVGFFGAKNEYNHNGEHIGGLFSFLSILRKILNDDLYHKVYVFWDGNFSGKLRYELYEPYKSGRGKNFILGTQPDDLSELNQRKLVWEYLNEMFIRQLKDEVVESDDFIAYYCLNKSNDEKITIVSGDRDFLQLINNDVRIYFLDLKNYIDSINYSSYFSYNIENSLLIKIMTGDASDSIKGIKGLGENTLLKLFPELKEKKITLDEIIIKAKDLQNERLNNKLKPLKVLNNIINRVTDGPQKENIYTINERIINLKEPLLTNRSIEEINLLINGSLSNDRDLKKVMEMMKRDGLDRVLGELRYSEFLLPFKKLIEREKNNI